MRWSDALLQYIWSELTLNGTKLKIESNQPTQTKSDQNPSHTHPSFNPRPCGGPGTRSARDTQALLGALSLSMTVPMYLYSQHLGPVPPVEILRLVALNPPFLRVREVRHLPPAQYRIGTKINMLRNRLCVEVAWLGHSNGDRQV